MKSWKLYDEMCKQYNVNFNVKGDTDKEEMTAEDQNFDDEAVQDDALNKQRD